MEPTCRFITVLTAGSLQRCLFELKVQHPVYNLTSCLVGRFHPFTGHEGPQGEQRYSSTLFQTSALGGGEGSASRPGSTLPPGKTRYPLYRRLGGPQGRSGLVRKISPHRDSIPGPSIPQEVAIPTTLPRPTTSCLVNIDFLGYPVS